MSYVKTYCLDVSGPFALFTNPAFKVERYTYPVITPSTIVGIYEAIYWKPQIKWVPVKIEVLSEIKYISFFRNEIKNKQSKNNKIIIEDNRTQRRSVVLKDVRYRIYAEMHLVHDNIIVDNNINLFAKNKTIFEDRANNGRHFHQPYFGCREFFVNFSLVNDFSNLDQSIDLTNDYNLCLYGIDFSNCKNKSQLNSKQQYYHCFMKNGVIDIPGTQGILTNK